MASANSEPGLEAVERRAGTLLGLMAGAAVACVGAGLIVHGVVSTSDAAWPERLFGLATTLVVLAPLVSLVGTALGALRGHRRLALLAAATLGVTLVGMALAR